MKCPNCGMENVQGKRFCGDCGFKLAVPTVEVEPRGARMCVSCGRPLDANAVFCAHCGKDTRITAASVAASAGAKKPLSSTLAVASLLMIVGGFISLAGLAILYHEYFGDRAYQVSALENMMTVVWVVSATIGIVGGISAAYRFNLGIAMTGAVFCIVAGYPIYYAGMIPGAAAFILLAVSVKEFSQ